MPARAPRIVRNSFILLGAGAVVLLGVVSGSIWLANDARASAERVTLSRGTRGHAFRVQSLAQDAETGQRGYLLTGRTSYLEPYLDARRELPGELAALDAALNQEGRDGEMDRAAALVRAKLDELDKTLQLARSGQRAAAIAMVNNDRGQALMDGIRDETDKIIASSDVRVRRATEAVRDNTRTQAVVSIAGGVMVVIFVLFAGWSALRYTRDLLRAREEIEALNHELEDRVSARTADLVRANEEIQRFAYIVSHDLRAPLVNVMGFTSELGEGLATVARYFQAGPRERTAFKADAERAAREEMPEALDFIRSSTQKMDGLINAILKISREGGRLLSPEEIDLGPLVERQAQALRHQFDATGSEFSLAGSPPTIVSDRLTLEQVFGNLVDNAVKYLDPSRPGRITAEFEDRGSRIEVALRDNGRGIAPQDFDRIFELFRRSGTQDRPGEGIGLAHVRTLVRRLGGEISVESRLNEGSCFRVTLPKTMSTAAAEPTR